MELHTETSRLITYSCMKALVTSAPTWLLLTLVVALLINNGDWHYHLSQRKLIGEETVPLWLQRYFFVVVFCCCCYLFVCFIRQCFFLKNNIFLLLFLLPISYSVFSLWPLQWQIQTKIRRGGHPDPEIKGGQSPKKIFSALWASVWSKNKGGHRSPGSLPWIRHCSTLKWHLCFCRLPLLSLESMLSLTTLNLMVSFQWWSCTNEMFICLACSGLQDSMCSYHDNWCKKHLPPFSQIRQIIFWTLDCIFTMSLPTDIQEQANICYE